MSGSHVNTYPQASQRGLAGRGRQGGRGRRSLHRPGHDARPDRRGRGRRRQVRRLRPVPVRCRTSTSTPATTRSRRWPTRRRRAGWRSARSSRRSGRRPAAARRWTRARGARSSSSRCGRDAGSPSGCASWASGPTAWSGSTRRASPAEWAADPEGQPEEDRRDVQAGRRRSPATTARSWPPKGRSAGAGCTRGGRWSTCSSGSASPRRVGFQADMAHTLLYTLGENAPEDRILPQDFDWRDQATARLGARDAHRRASAVDDRFPRRPERRHRLRLGHARPDRPALPGERPQRQARHPAPRRLLAPRRERQADQAFRHICWDGCMFPNAVMMEPEDLERHPRRDDPRPRRPRMDRVSE